MLLPKARFIGLGLKRLSRYSGLTGLTGRSSLIMELVEERGAHSVV